MHMMFVSCASVHKMFDRCASMYTLLTKLWNSACVHGMSHVICPFFCLLLYFTKCLH